MKKTIYLFVALATGFSASAQVGINTTTPDPSAALDIASTTKGLLLPRMNSTQMNLIAAPAVGLMVYCTDCTPLGNYQYNNGSWGVLGATGSQGIQGPSGANGTNGSSAYQLAVANGFVGTEAEWLTSLIGATGPQGIQGPSGANGTNGSSAYQLAVANGFVGTEAEWLTSLIGATGSQGIQGPAGADGTTLPDADASTKGKIQLAGDLGGDASAPTIKNNAVTTAKIADANVTESKIASDAVTSTKILDGTIATADLANDAVETANIKDNAVTVAKLPTGATATTFLRGDGTWVTPFKSATISKNSSYVFLDSADVTPNHITTITFIGSSPQNFAISDLPAGNTGKILNIYNAGGSNIAGSFNRSGDGSAQSLTINAGRGFSLVWDGQGWARTSY